MRKQITILQENTSPLVLDDQDERPIKEYTDSLAKLLESNNVTLLHTTSCSVIIRPHKVTSIIVKDFSTPPPKEEEPSEEKEEVNEEDSPDGIISD